MGMRSTVTISQMLLALCVILSAGLLVHGDPPASQSAIVAADSPEAAAIRQQLIDWNTRAPTMSLEEFRKIFHTETDREATYCDWLGHEQWEECKTQDAVGKKWGVGGETLFAHANGTDTLDDDRQCAIKLDGDHATVTFVAKEIAATRMIKVDRHWLIDIHTVFPSWLAQDPRMETDRQSTGKLMKRARADIDAGKFGDAESFLADFKARLASFIRN